MAQLLTLTRTHNARFHAGVGHYSLPRGWRTYYAVTCGIDAHPIAEVVAPNAKEGKRLLAEALAEKFAPRYEHGGYEPRFFRVVWC
jgi:hypothetical protein